ncbi:hypothetical protein TRFO_09359 [Tritrichomonas foetus]|uniref:EF hand family protein n=1 Tax=Tritrichomonas foetus TaxID=1144522 RepID=A0A1J4JEW5_9EUKA|nr:hypothetical protein TRFO_09359 [Tritrichomonas foetus]|eukprot:OHS97648.1 hypothetical protein TRFO_09359 [Tritrichomonas foetus]
MTVIGKITSVLDLLDDERDKGVKTEYKSLLQNSSVTKSIPPLLLKRRNNEKSISLLVNDWAKERSLNSLRNNFPTIEDIDNLRNSMSSTGTNTRFPRISRVSSRTMRYSDYCQLRNKWPEHFSCYLTSKLFLDLCRPGNHTILPDELFSHLTFQSNAIDYYIILRRIDRENSGSINKKQLSKFVNLVSKNYEFVDDIEDKFDNGRKYYIIFVVERFFSMLDPLGTNSISIDNLVSCNLFSELVKLEEYSPVKPNTFGESQCSLYIQQFLDMDGDNDGFLTQDDLLHMPDTRFTYSFVEQLFDTMIVSGKFDFYWFCRFKNAYTHLGKPWANLIFFDIIDIDKNNIINETEINYFYHDLSRDFEDYYEKDPPLFQDYENTILDLCSMTKSFMTKEEYIKSSESAKLTQLLIDLKPYVKFENNDNIPARGM